jgi:hypothetical protein
VSYVMSSWVNEVETVQLLERDFMISCDAETDEVVERNQCEYDPS